MARSLSPRITSMAGSATLQASNKARALKRQGIDVVDLGGGDPDFATPEHIQRAAIASMQAGNTHYVAASGIPELRKAIADKLAGDSGVQVDHEKGVIVTSGGKLALYITMMTLVGDGDEVILPEPAWVTYRPVIELAGGKVVPLSLTAADGFAVTAEAINALISPRTRAILFNSPSNPTGKVMTRAEIETIAAAAKAHDLWVVADEMYEKIIFDGRQAVSIASLPGMAERTVILNGFSKTYAMTGWRMGYLAGPVEVVQQASKMQEQTATCAPSFAQVAGVAALDGPQDEVERMRTEYQRRRDFFVAALNDVPGVSCFVPEGAFYAFPHFDLGMDSMQLTDVLLDKARVAGTPGSAFGEAGNGHVRFSFATSPKELEIAARRIKEALS